MDKLKMTNAKGDTVEITQNGFKGKRVATLHSTELQMLKQCQKTLGVVIASLESKGLTEETKMLEIVHKGLVGIFGE
jgi:hypothetical protein